MKWIREWCKQNNYKYEKGTKNIGRCFKVEKFSKDDIITIPDPNDIFIQKPIKKLTNSELWDDINTQAAETWKK